MSRRQVSVEFGPGLGIASVTTLVFVILKLTHVVDWTWVWVLSPLWFTLIGTLAFMAILLCLAAVVTSAHDRRWNKTTRRGGTKWTR